MMLKALVVVGATLLSGPVLAVECQVGASGPLRLDEWSIADDLQSVYLTYTNVSGREISISQGAAFFFDTLGSSVGFAAFDPDTDIPPDGSVTATAPAVGLERTSKLKPEEIQAAICLTGVVYADGTTENFE